MAVVPPSTRPTPPPDAGDSWLDPVTNLFWDRDATRWYDPEAGTWIPFAAAPTSGWSVPVQPSAGPVPPWDAPPPQSGPAPTSPAKGGFHVGPLRGGALAAVGGGVVAVVALVVVLALVLTSGGSDSTPSAGGAPVTAATPSTGAGAGSGSSASGSDTAAPTYTGTPTDLPTAVPNLTGLSLALPNSDAGDPEAWPNQLPVPAPLAKASDSSYLYDCDGKPQNYDGPCATADVKWDGNYATKAVWDNYVAVLGASGLTADDRNESGSVPQAKFHGANFDIDVALDKREAKPVLDIVVAFYAPAYDPYS